MWNSSTNEERVAITAPAAPPGLRKKRARRIIAVGGGKGGIGKTLLTANLGIALAKRGCRVVVVDADLGGANLHTCLGISQPAVTLSDYVSGRAKKLQEIIIPVGVENLSLIPGGRDALDAANPKYQQKSKLLRNLAALDADYLLLDLAAGTSLNVLDFFLMADRGLVVLLPEPTSIENAYRFIRAAFFRRLQALKDADEVATLVSEAVAKDEPALKTPHEFVAWARTQNPAAAERLQHEASSFRAGLVVNQSRSKADQDLGHAVVSAWKKFFGLSLDYVGAIGYDDDAWRAVRKRRPLLLERPDCPAAAGLLKVAENVLALDRRLVQVR
jgi:flagellar biosynthesis protein FlhG